MPTETPEECKARWTKAFRPLIGRTIRAVRWMNDEEQHTLDWDFSPIVIELDDGTLMYPSADDEGNAAGALFLQTGKGTPVPETAPVI